MSLKRLKREQSAAALAQDIGRRLGSSLALRKQSEGGYRIDTPEMTLAETELLLEWLDYYVATLDEQRVRAHGSSISPS